MPSDSSSIDCRFCAERASYVFSLLVLNRHNVSYFKCGGCGSLQTEEPYWLDEAYKVGNLSDLDTGAAQRVLSNLSACFALGKLFGARNVVDIGGGDGLLTRLLRDYGINCYSKDKYSKATYALGFTEEDFDVPDMILGFEILEHLSNPRKELEMFFGKSARVVLLSTEMYEEQDKDWWYLSPESGQHIFFYSKSALEAIGNDHGYQMVLCGSYILYLRQASRLQIRIARIILKSKTRGLVRAAMALLPTPSVWTDHLSIKKKTG